MHYDFDAVVDRHNTNSAKWDFCDKFFGTKDVLPLWVADMDFRSPQPVIDAVRRVAEHGIFGYTGIPQSYYEAAIDWMKRRYDWEIQKDWFVFTPGVVTAINMLIRTFAQPGDGIVLQTPVYYPFFSCVNNNDCRFIDNPLRFENGQYVMDLDDLEKKIDERTKMIILCSPHNPVGRVWTRDELTKLGVLCLRKNLLIIADEIHEDIVYPGSNHTAFASIAPEFADRTITCTSASKTFNLAGLHTSNIIISNQDLRERFQKTLTRCAVHSADPFGIAAAEAAFRYGEDWLRQLIAYLQGNLSFMTSRIEKRMPQVDLIQPQGTYLAWLDCRHIGITQPELKDSMIYKAKLGIEEGMPFGAKEPGYFRLNFACPRATLQEALERLEKLVISR